MTEYWQQSGNLNYRVFLKHLSKTLDSNDKNIQYNKTLIVDLWVCQMTPLVQCITK